MDDPHTVSGADEFPGDSGSPGEWCAVGAGAGADWAVGDRNGYSAAPWPSSWSSRRSPWRPLSSTEWRGANHPPKPAPP